MPGPRGYVAVIGPDQASGQEITTAEAVGVALAQGGAAVVCGGLGGVMEGACRGALAAGGLTIGILPGSDRAAANRFVVVALPTGLGELRNGLVVRAADAVIAVGGSYGTLSEIALALKARRPVVGLGTWELARDGVPDDSVAEAASPQQAVGWALAAIGR